MRVKLLNVEVDNYTMVEFLSVYKSGVVVTPNVDHLMKLQKDEEFQNVYKHADYVVLDSRVIYYLLKLTGSPIKGVIPGSDLFPAFCEYHKNNADVTVFLLGAQAGVAAEAQKNINARIGRNIVVGSYSPTMMFEDNEQENQKIIDEINKSGATVLAVGLGAPKQEKWVCANFDKLPFITRAMSIGATIDFEAGNIKRAPAVFQKAGLEWLYRLMSEPQRLWKRYLIEDLPFFFLFFKQKVGLYRKSIK